DINGTAIVSTGNFGSNSRISGPINIAANQTMLVGSSFTGLLRLSSPISGAGSVNYSTDGSVMIDGNNTYTGTTTVGSARRFGLGSDTAFGIGGVVNLNFGSFFALGGNRTISNPITLNDDIYFGTDDPAHQGFDLTFSGPCTLNGSFRNISTIGAGRYTLTNVGGGAVQLIKNGGDTLVLAGANNTYGGATTVSEDRLPV